MSPKTDLPNTKM